MWQSCFWRSFLILYCLDKHKTRKICDETAGDSLAALKLIPDWFVASKMIKKLYTTLYADESVFYFNEDSDNIVFSCNEMGILNIDLNNINLDNGDYNEDDPKYIIYIRLLVWDIKSEKRRTLKKELSEGLMLVA